MDSNAELPPCSKIEWLRKYSVALDRAVAQQVQKHVDVPPCNEKRAPQKLLTAVRLSFWNDITEQTQRHLPYPYNPAEGWHTNRRYYRTCNHLK